MELLNTNRKSQVRSKFGPGRKNWGSRGGAPDPGASAASPPGDKSSMEAEGPGPFSLSQPRTYCTGPRPRPPGSPPYFTVLQYYSLLLLPTSSPSLLTSTTDLLGRLERSGIPRLPKTTL